ncbi:MAG: MBL fold metallo-hydrolase, partial [Phycisphaerae bacterium]
HIDGPFDLGGRIWTPIPLIHGRGEVLGFRIGNFAYCTDCSSIPAASRELLQSLDVLIIDALRPDPHPSHLSFAQALSIIADLQPKQAFFTHLTHDVAHLDVERQLPPHVRACYDGLRLEIT